MIQFLIDNPLFTLFFVAAIGYPLGRIKFKGISLGVAAVLFVGLAVGALDPNLKLPEVIYQLGLVMFVYTIGLSSGPSFFASLRRKGLRYNVLVVSMLVLGALLTLGAHVLLNLSPGLTAGMFSGNFTNTPALASSLDYIKNFGDKANLDHLLSEPVIGYSVTYPMGIISALLAITCLQRWFKIDYKQDAKNAPQLEVGIHIQNRTIRVTCPEATSIPIGELAHQHHWDVIFGRLQHQNQLSLSNVRDHLCDGDLVSVIGPADQLESVTSFLGEVHSQQLDYDRNQIDFRRVFVSNPTVAGHRIQDLNIYQQYGALATRIKRGDSEFLPQENTVLQLGDRIRVVAPRNQMDGISQFFGDSYRMLSEIDFLTFSLGLTLGLLLGTIPFPLPGGLTLKLGAAGGPLLVAMVLGTLGRTGPLVWNLPYSANLTLRQVGFILFLAGVGTRSGYAFVTTFVQGNGLPIFVVGAVIVFVVSTLTLWIGYKLLKIPMGMVIGMLAGLQTQPAVLGFTLEQADNDLPNAGYASVYPLAIIVKIIMAQLIVMLLK
ncbi:MAG: transporter [Anaerolineaceae bacterium]|nr:transporter [Anaerolineaceae bacterium]